jgi:hypothetical protein
MQGTIQDCEIACTSKSDCIGFSRRKSAAHATIDQCWLKKRFPNRAMNEPNFHTFVKP